MVQRVIRHDSAAGERATEMRNVKRRRDAIMAIKKQMLRCSEQGRRFKRGYLASGCGGERGDAADSAIFYLACLVCTTERPSLSE